MIPLGVLGSARVAASVGGPPVAGYSAWWDFSDTSTLTLSGAEITVAADKSGNGHTLTKSATGGPSSTTSASLGGGTLAVARFDGTNGKLLTNAGNCGVTGDQSVFIVTRKQSPGPTGSNADPLFSLRALSIYAASSILYLWRGTTQTTVSNNTALQTTAGVHTRIVSGTAHSYWINAANYVNGVAGNAGASATTYLGGEPTPGSDWEVGEVVVYPAALPSTDRASVVSYLSTKWGI